MAKIVHSVKVWDIVGATLADVVTIIGKDHPKMTQKERDVKAAQRHIIELFAEQLREAWPTVHGPQFGVAEVIQYEG